MLAYGTRGLPLRMDACEGHRYIFPREARLLPVVEPRFQMLRSRDRSTGRFHHDDAAEPESPLL